MLWIVARSHLKNPDSLPRYEPMKSTREKPSAKKILEDFLEKLK